MLGMEVVLADGEILTLGGKNVKTSSGYSLIDLMVGSEGNAGHPDQAHGEAGSGAEGECEPADSL